MRQKDIRTRIAEVEAEAKAPDLEGIETEEENEKSPNKKLVLIMTLIMTAILVYILVVVMLPELVKGIK